MASNKQEWFLQLVDSRRAKPVDDDTGSFQVYTAGSPVRTAITDASGATLTQESVATAGNSFISRTMTDGKIRFFANATVTSVDLSILTAGGRAYFLKALKPSDHRVDVDPDKNEYTLVAAINDKASSTLVRPLGFKLKKGMVIKDVYVNVVTAFVGAATGNNKFGFGRSAAAGGFVVAASLKLSAAGFVQPIVLSSTGIVVAGQQWGTDLRQMKTGNATNFGWLYRKSYLVPATSTSNNLVFKRGTALTASVTAANAVLGKGYVYYNYTLLPTELATVVGT